LRDPAAAEDATSQTFLRAMSALASYRETGRFRAWLFTLAHNVIVNAAQRQKFGAPIEAAWEVSDPSATPEDLAVAALDLADVDAAIAGLSADDRRVIELRRAGLSGREIAEVLGISHEAAKKRQLRAMDRLEAALNAKRITTGGRDGR
jgi:RNA polymerase sigma-70 factor (ECF subfamily)